MRTLMRTVRRLAGVAIVLTLATTAMPPAAQADHGDTSWNGNHEPIPVDMDRFIEDTKGYCDSVDWRIDFTEMDDLGFLTDTEPSHGHYKFQSYTYHHCPSVDPRVNQNFEVRGDGGTDGHGRSLVYGGRRHGEELALGWSHSSGYDDDSSANKDSTAAAACDELTSNDNNQSDIWFWGTSDGREYSGWMKFVRSGLHMVMWGCAANHQDPNVLLTFSVEGELHPLDHLDEYPYNEFEFRGVGTMGIRDVSPPPTTTTTTSTTTTSTTTSSTTTTTMPPPDVPLVDTVTGIEEPSARCKNEGGTRIMDSTTFGVESILYTYQPSADELWVCTRVEDTGSGDGYGGRLEVTPAGGAPSISGGPGDPSVDEASSACTTTTDPPNQIPTTHPMAHGGIGPVDYMIDAYSNDSEAWVCLQVDDTDTRVVVPFDDPVPEVSFGTMVTWWPDQGTPPS